MQVPHADGIGSYNALILIYERIEGTDLYGLLPFDRPGRTHWTLSFIKQVMGDISDRQLLSFIFEGVRWGVDAPRQIRVATNLQRMTGRARGVAAAYKKLLDKGLYYKYRRLRRADERIDPDGPGPLLHIPTYVVGSGGTDKADNPEEKRVVGNQSAPHPDEMVRERNRHDGEADGPVAESLNDMMGPPPGTTRRGHMLDATRYPMPHPEGKPRPKHCYSDNAVLRYQAGCGGTHLVGVKDDGRHMFFQFEMSASEEW